MSHFYRLEMPSPSDFETEEEYQEALDEWEHYESDWEDTYIEEQRMREDND